MPLSTHARIAALLFLLAVGSATATTAKEDGGSSPRSVTIGEQTWMADNLDLTTFRNGDPIMDTPDAAAWVAANQSRSPALSAYGNDPANRRKWGLLYNYFAVSDPRGLCPAGWRIPDDRDWDQLEAFLGRDLASFRMKSASGWAEGGAGSDDSGFGGLPGGFRIQDGSFRLGRRVAYWWSATQDAKGEVTSILLFDYDRKIFRIAYPKELGQSVRCIRERTS